MKLKLAIDPDIVALMAAEVAAGERAVTAAMRQAGTGLKSAWRGQITGAGLGTRLPNSIRLASFPKSGESLNVAALVWSNAPVIIGAHDTSPLIRSKNSFWLATPTAAATVLPRRMGTPHGVAPEVHLSPEGAQVNWWPKGGSTPRAAPRRHGRKPVGAS